MTSERRLAALGAHLSSRGFKVDLTARGLSVRNPNVPGCCDEVAHASDTIACRPRLDDGGRLWFFTSWNAPIAEADRITDATMAIKANLAGRAYKLAVAEAEAGVGR
jgi:hypothetical protein